MQKYHDFIDRKRDERRRVQERESAEKDHNHIAESATDGHIGNFWCVACKREYQAKTYKRLGHKGRWVTAWYTGRCRCGKVNIRRITDMRKDMYFWKSPMIKRERRDVDYATIDPNHPLFPVIYPKQYRKLEEEKYAV